MVTYTHWAHIVLTNAHQLSHLHHALMHPCALEDLIQLQVLCLLSPKNEHPALFITDSAATSSASQAVNLHSLLGKCASLSPETKTENGRRAVAMCLLGVGDINFVARVMYWWGIGTASWQMLTLIWNVYPEGHSQNFNHLVTSWSFQQATTRS